MSSFPSGPARTDAPSRQRFIVLDSLRGVFAVMIVLLHTGMQSHIFYSPLTRNAAFFVDFFFVLSGFVIAYAYKGRVHDGRSLLAFLVRRFGRLWPLHAFVLALFVAFFGLRVLLGQLGIFETEAAAVAPERLRFAAEMLAFVHIFRNETVYWLNFPAWSIAAEFWAYVLFGVICLSGRSTAILAAGLAVGASAVWIFALEPGFGEFFGYGLFKGVGNFFVGYFTFYVWQRLDVSLGAVSASLLELFLFGLAVAHLLFVDVRALTVGMPLVFALTILVCSQEKGLISRILLAAPFRVLGERSYSIYLIHAFVLMILGLALTVLDRLVGVSFASVNRLKTDGSTLIDFGGPIVNDIATIALVLCVVWLAGFTYKYVELPGQKLSKSWAGRIGVAKPA